MADLDLGPNCGAVVLFVVILFAAPAAAANDTGTFTLYRDSVVSSIHRVHVATFDASDGRDYNRENCTVARTLFQKQEGVSVNYWCEPGRFHE